MTLFQQLFRRLPQQVQRALSMAIKIVRELSSDQISLTAAGIAFFSFLSLVPALAAAVNLYAIIARPEGIGLHLAQLEGIVPSALLNFLLGHLERLAATSGRTIGLSTVSATLISLWSASRAARSMLKGLDQAYRVTERRNGFLQQGIALLLTAAAGALWGAANLLLALVPAFLDWTGLFPELEQIVRGLRWPTIYIATLVLLLLVYRFGPSVRPASWSNGLPGAVMVSICWLLLSAGFGSALEWVGDFNRVYGSFAPIVVLLLWLYFSAGLFLVGAKWNAVSDRPAKPHRK